MSAHENSVPLPLDTPSPTGIRLVCLRCMILNLHVRTLSKRAEHLLNFYSATWATHVELVQKTARLFIICLVARAHLSCWQRILFLVSLIALNISLCKPFVSAVCSGQRIVRCKPFLLRTIPCTTVDRRCSLKLNISKKCSIIFIAFPLAVESVDSSALYIFCCSLAQLFNTALY